MAQGIKLDKFLKSLWEDGKLIMYPDFLMNSFSLMASQVLLNSKSEVSDDFRAVAFKFIRTPIELCQVNKGHRADVVFKCFTQFVDQRVMLDFLLKTEFDAHVSLTYAVASPHNYTRNSASKYFCSLVAFAWVDEDEIFIPEILPGQESVWDENVQTTLRAIISCALNDVYHELTASAKDGACNSVNNILHKKSCENASVRGHFLKLVADCCVQADIFLHPNIEDLPLELLDIFMSLGQDETVECHEFLLPFFEMLIPIDGCRERIEELIWCFCKRKDVSVAADVMCAATLVDSYSAEMTKWAELAILPLTIACGSGRSSGLQDQCPEFLKFIKATMDGGTLSQCSTLIQTAVRNIMTYDTRMMEKSKSPAKHLGADLIDYLQLKTLETPADVTKPFLCAGAVSARPASLCVLLCVFEYYQQHIELLKNESVSACIQEYSKVLLQHSDLNYKQLDSVLHVYISTLSHLFERPTTDVTCDQGASDKTKTMSILQEVVINLNKKMVNPDARVREVAVKAVGMLYLQGSMKINNLLLTCNSLTSMCQCLKDLNEDVAMQILNVLHQAALKGFLDCLIKLAGEEKDALEAALMKFLQSHKWDNIKSTAFKLLAQMSQSDRTVAYAELCLRQANSQLSSTVMEHAGRIILSVLDNKNLSVEHQVDALISWIEKGWGDLVLYKADAHDTTSFRIASDLMLKISSFMNKAEVLKVVTDKTSEIFKQSSEFTLTKFFYEEFGNSALLLGADENSGIYFHGEPLVKKRKISETTSETSNTLCSSKDTTCLLCLLASLNSSKDPAAIITENSNNEQDRVEVRKSEDFTLDSTKELMPLTLRTEPLPLAMLIKTLTHHLDPENLPETILPQLRKLLCFVAYRGILTFLNPQKLCHEAQRSTDVYTRNPTMLLHDLETAVERSLKDATERIEQEVAEIFVKKLPDLRDCAIKQSSANALNDLAAFIATIIPILKDRKELASRVLEQRRILLNKPEEPQKITTDDFLKRLECFKKHGSKLVIADQFFQSQEGLNNLLMVNARLRCPLGVKPLSEKRLQELIETGNSAQSEIINSEEFKEQREKLLTLFQKHGSIQHSVDAKEQIASLPWWSFAPVITSLDTYLEPLDKLKDKVDHLVKSDKRKSFQSLLDVLHGVAQHLFLKALNVTECKEQQVSDGQLSIFVIADLVHNWFLSEDDEFDSDGDNDPTLIDCY